MSKLVSVIIPTYNRADKVADAIESAITQSYNNVQIIVIDDGSSDNTADIVKRYPQVEYHFKPNGGQASARNLGLKFAKGEIIASLDSDDIWMPAFLERCVEKLEADKLDFVFANWDQESKYGENYDYIKDDYFLKHYNRRQVDSWVNLNDEELRSLYIESCLSPSSSGVLRKSSIISGWDETMNIGDDWCMYLEMVLSKKCKAAYTLDQLWKKRIDKINVYNGRKWSEILEFLYIADLENKMIKFRNLLRKSEFNVLKKRYLESLVELSKHNIFREFDFIYAFRLLGRAFSYDVPNTFRAIPKVYMMSFERKVLDKLKKTPKHS